MNVLIDDCVKNSRKAQERLFQLFYGKMLFVCLRYHHDHDTAQEVVQEGFIKVFNKISTFDKQGSLEAWIKRIMVNTSIDLIRKNKKVNFVELEDHHNKNLIDENDFFDIETDVNAQTALACIQELSPAYRTVFNLFYLEEYTHKEIAEELGISEGTSKSNLSKAKLKLKEILEQKSITKFTNE